LPGPFDTVAPVIRLRIRLTPNARKEGFGWIVADEKGTIWLKANVRAIAENGRANAALIKMLAKATGLAPGEIEIITGQSSRMKILALPEKIGLEEALTKLSA